MTQFIVGLGAGIIVGLLIEWLIDWSSFSVRRSGALPAVPSSVASKRNAHHASQPPNNPESNSEGTGG
jgi:hypothetical protein